jgi:hypothetical protein
MKTKPCFIFHKWTKWNDVVWGKEKRMFRSNLTSHVALYQVRSCKKCNCKQVRSSDA